MIELGFVSTAPSLLPTYDCSCKEDGQTPYTLERSHLKHPWFSPLFNLYLKACSICHRIFANTGVVIPWDKPNQWIWASLCKTGPLGLWRDNCELQSTGSLRGSPIVLTGWMRHLFIGFSFENPLSSLSFTFLSYLLLDISSQLNYFVPGSDLGELELKCSRNGGREHFDLKLLAIEEDRHS